MDADVKRISGFITAVHENNRADVLLTTGNDFVTVPNAQYLPHLHLERGYRVLATVYMHDVCVTDVIGFVNEAWFTEWAR